MAIETIDATLIPPTAFVRRSRLLESKDWKETVAALPTIKAGKAARIALSPETLHADLSFHYQSKERDGSGPVATALAASSTHAKAVTVEQFLAENIGCMPAVF